jgi:hypothetical protein
VQRASRTMRGFVALIALAGAMSLLRCSPSIQSAIADDLNNQSFTFTSGAVFNPGLANIETTLVFFNNAANFTLSSAGGTAAGSNTFGNACTLTVLDSTYAIGVGPQVNDAISILTTTPSSSGMAQPRRPRLLLCPQGPNSVAGTATDTTALGWG